ncbi:longitudinals lacking protein, isoforms A/B/D/L-like [Pogonomyrmex barbatus]|uniref:Longitudinals lacking protein, isoforms A/B/D/L-like n=1 Tax=Pogonomyrmex barbatus TaxID=144034 RepID=A0A6I9WCU0_9HYME|nr:longitudinals lacking protein, isoforms A/B/D/L-like [Pogonomyrmex barbatus]
MCESKGQSLAEGFICTNDASTALLWPYKVEQEYNANDEQQLQRLSFVYENCETYVCADCGKTYVAKRSLWRHQKFECVNAKPRLRCDMCSYNTPHKWCLDRHRRQRRH